MRDKLIKIPFPADDSGMLPRECPRCGRKFAIDKQDYSERCFLNLRCPYCQWIEEFNEFHTEEQLKYAEALLQDEFFREAEKEIKQSLKKFQDSMKRKTSKYNNFAFKAGSNVDNFNLNNVPEKTPSPHLDISTQEITCEDCNFSFLVDNSVKEDETACPVCR